MTVRVHYHPTDLQDAGEVEVLKADEFEIEDDNTVRLFKVETVEGKKRRRTVGFIHPNRWDSIIQSDKRVTR